MPNAPCERNKTTSEKRKFGSNKKLAFSLHFLFRRDQNHYPNLTSKILKMCEQILKKHSRKNSENDSTGEIAHTYD